MAAPTTYLVTDRTSSVVSAIRINDGQLEVDVNVAGTAQAEPTLRDRTNPGTHWTLYVDDDQIGIETATTSSILELILNDFSGEETWALRINDGQLEITGCDHDTWSTASEASDSWSDTSASDSWSTTSAASDSWSTTSAASDSTSSVADGSETWLNKELCD